MQITISQFRANVGKYVKMASTVDVVITKHGKPIVKIIRYQEMLADIKKILKNTTIGEKK